MSHKSGLLPQTSVEQLGARAAEETDDFKQ